MLEDLEKLKIGCAQIISEAELQKKLNSGRRLNIKLGVDPTSPDLHLGHSIALRKLRSFQDLGHQAILIIGDFTAMIGDPSGKSVTRPPLTSEEVKKNAETYLAQCFKILDKQSTKVVYNGDWFRQMTYEKIIRLNSSVTLQQMLQREDFKKRIADSKEIHLHEIQYPIMQGWDSVVIESDVELGGTDQLFNILVGRDLQKSAGQEQQVVMLLPILEGLDGIKKMSKSLDNYIGIDEPPASMFGKMMSISDELMAKYYPLLLGKKLDKNLHPMTAKKNLAKEIIATYHSQSEAKKALEEFEQRFSQKNLNALELPEFNINLNNTADTKSGNAGIGFIDLVAKIYAESFGLQKSNSDIRRLIKGGSIQLNSHKCTSINDLPDFKNGDILRLDKKHSVRLKLS